MKNLLIVVVALSVFTSVSAQRKINFAKDLNYGAEGIVYTPVVIKIPARQVLAPLVSATELCSALQFKYAQLLNREVESITDLSLFSFIENWWGTRYRFGGSTKKGIDCSSFTGLLINTVFGISLPRTARAQYAACTKVQRCEMAEGDLVFFNTRGGVSHVGVYLGDGYFTHSSCSNGVTISNLDEAYYSKRFIGAGRPGVMQECLASLN